MLPLVEQKPSQPSLLIEPFKGGQTDSAGGTKARAIWVDVARVIATVLIVAYHVPCSSFASHAHPEIWQDIKAFFVVPGGILILFFFLSGYFSPMDMGWGKRLRRVVMLLLAYVVWNSLFSLGLRDEWSFARVFGFGGLPCADYPMWYVWTLALLILWQGLGRVCVYLLGVFSLVCIFGLGNHWPVAVHEYITVPSPVFTASFVVGCLLSPVRIQLLQKVFLYCFPVFLLVCMLPLPQDFAGPVAAALVLSAGSLFQSLWLRGAACFASLASASFLCYAVHAGVLVGLSQILSYTFPAALGAQWLAGLLPFAIYGGSVVVLALMRRYTPILLPLLAYSGRLGWLDKLEKWCGDSR